jgi:solute carrier family 25 carnitine/acylcarnitine transporter 20/29
MGFELGPEIIDFIAGSVAGAVSVAVGQPFDTVKVRIQTSMEYKGPVDCVQKIVKQEGFNKLFSGMLPPLITMSALNAVIFTTYGHINRLLSKEDEKSSLVNMFISGSVAGVAQSFLQCPTELVKIKLQAKTERKQSMMRILNNIYHSQGIKGFFRGYESTLYRDTPGYGVYFATYYFMMEKLENCSGKPIASFISGGIAGAASWIITYPFDIIKSQVQMSNPEVPVKNIFLLFKDISQKQGGYKIFYRGLGTTIVRSIPVNAVLFPVYEACVFMLGQDK